MPLIEVEFLKQYTDNEDIKLRDEFKIQADIAQAESKVFQICNHDFSDNILYPEIPFNVKLATAILTEFYSQLAINRKKLGFRSESFDDYNYTLDDSKVESSMPDVVPLLKPYIKDLNKLGTQVKMGLRVI